MEYISQLAKFGLNVEFFASRQDSQGNYIDENGSYDPDTHTMLIDINAMKKSSQEISIVRKGMLKTAFHELTHVSEHSTKEYVELREAVAEAVGKDACENEVEHQLRLFKKTNSEKYNSMTEEERIEYASKEALAEACTALVDESDLLIKMAEDNPSVGQKIINAIKGLIKKIRDFLKLDGAMDVKIARVLKENADNLQDIVNKWDNAVMQGMKNQNAKQAVKETSEQKNNTANDGVQYSLNRNAKAELHKVLYETNYRNDVLLRDNTPSIMLAQKGVKDLPMVMKSSHIRENVFTEDEAKKLGLKVNKHTHYHGLGEDFYLQIIDNLDNVTEAYRGTKYADNSDRRENFFLLVSEFKDADGNIINIPIYINETAQHNRMFILSNKIATVFGKENFRDYISREIRKGNLVRIKNRSKTSSERNALIAKGYKSIASNSNISQNDTTVNNKPMQKDENNSTQQSARDRDYRDTDLSTLDDKELKVYNNRGWANSLFTDEDLVLLREKYNELNTKTKQRTDNVLGDGSRIVEVNNKLVLMGGTFEDPIIYNVLAINADNETDADIIKEFIYHESNNYRTNQKEYTEFLEYVQVVQGEEFVRSYNADNFKYFKGRNTERATLPSYFNYYGYTKQFPNRRGDSSETEQGISHKVDNTQLDIERGTMLTEEQLIARTEDKVNQVPDFDDLLDEDLDFDITDSKNKERFNQLINTDPHKALDMVYKSYADTIENVVSRSKDINLVRKIYLKLIIKYHNL